MSRLGHGNHRRVAAARLFEISEQVGAVPANWPADSAAVLRLSSNFQRQRIARVKTLAVGKAINVASPIIGS